MTRFTARARGLCCSLALLGTSSCANVLGFEDSYYVAGADGGGGSNVAGAGGASSFTVPPGKLVFERYTTYDAGDSQMFLANFPDKTLSSDLGARYGLCSPLNGIFSPDGTKLVLGATIRAGACPALDRSQLELFILDLENPGAKQQITSNQVPDEDAQYSPDGSFILFKHDGNLAYWKTGTAPFDEKCSDPSSSYCFDHAYAASSGTEQSKPVTDGNLVCYGWGNSADVTADIFCFDLADGLAGKDVTDPAVRMPAVVHASLSDARPVIAPPYLYFTRWRSPSSHVNEIGRTLLSDITGTQSIASFCIDPGVGYEDAFSLDGQDLVVFSSNANGYGKGDLFIGDFSQVGSENLDAIVPGINTVNDELGAAFWRAP